jgi:hypothetical protein
MSVCLNVRVSVAGQRPNNWVVFSLESVLRTRCRGNFFRLIIIIHHLLLGKGGVFLSVSSVGPLPWEHLFLIIIKYKIPGTLSPGVKGSGREAEIQPELQKR